MRPISPLEPPTQLQLGLSIPNKERLNIPETAELLGCSVRQVQYMLQDGTLLGIPKSRKSPLDPSAQRIHYSCVLRASVERFLKERVTG